MKTLLHHFARVPGLEECRALLARRGHCAIAGTNAALLAALVEWLRSHLKTPVLVLARDAEEAERLHLNFHTVGAGRTALFSAHMWDAEEHLPNDAVNLERMETLTGLLAGALDVVVAPCMAVLQDVPAPQQLDAQFVRIAKGQSLDMIDLVRRLLEHGYDRTDMVEFRGECSVRGGILDVFPVTAEHPVRIEFFGDEISSIRQFELHTQRSVEGADLDSLAVPPARETAVVDDAGDDSATRMFLLDYFPTPPLVVWHEFRRVLEGVRHWSGGDDVPRSLQFAARRFDALQGRCKDLACLYAQELDVDVPESVADNLVCVATSSFSLAAQTADMEPDGTLKPHEYVLRTLARQLAAWHEQQYTVSLACSTDADRDRLTDLLTREAHVPRSSYRVLTAPLTQGWILADAHVAVVTDDEIFHRVYTRRRRARKLASGRTTPIENIATIAIGEYVVHVNHGIGQFEGIRAIDIEDAKREMIVVRYADDAFLYVPLEHAHLLDRYVSMGDGTPQLDALGSGRWMARRRRAERAVLDLAAELLERQARRHSVPGHAFAPDNDWQLSFEKSFPYAETPDQARAIVEVKEDMEAPRPMDRLVCGDVGFGKTEVALRAAFKAVMDGRQVAVLVPTTILAQQHWHTFSERMAEYPVRVAVLSRFVGPREQKAIATSAAAGDTDVVIGTHRLLSADMKFSNLGLVVVDEEHRFGVRHKEKLKKMCELVDVLTLSATPIPRTLYQSLTGARDMSTILTPPDERMPVKTLLIKRDYRIVREAIMRELARGGQVFFLHNRIATIERIHDILRQIVPDARIVTAHGQMPEHQLAETMEDFNARKHDILVCTMIVESGLDLPNVNTIIVDDAHHFGLADLYQLRGRVGRSNRQAYCYLIIPTDLVVDGAARHRLKAILENTALGSGYAIAMKDLEIRGAGNLLGAQQSGHIAAIGFTLYCKLLQRAVDILKKGGRAELLKQHEAHHAADGSEAETERKFDWRKEIPHWQPVRGVELLLPFNGNISEEYVESAALRLDLFHRIGAARTVELLRKIEDEMRDRFGPVPDAALLLVRLAETRIHARIRGIDCIEDVEGKVVLRREGKITNATEHFPRITGLRPLQATDVVLAALHHVQPLH